MKQYDLVIQLGSQVKYSPAGYSLAPHTGMRTLASMIALKNGVAQNLMIAGGSNFGVRYDDQELLKPAVFTFAAFANSDYNRKSEAAVIKDFLVRDYGVSSNRIFAETLSSTTEENAEFVKIILRRRPMFTGGEKLAILTLLYHMERALPIFQKAGLGVDPLFAENILAEDDPAWIDKICEYYKTPKGGKQYDVERIRQLLTESKSLEEIIMPWWRIIVPSSYLYAGDTSFTQAWDLSGAAVKFRELLKRNNPSGLEQFIKGPFETEEQASKA